MTASVPPPSPQEIQRKLSVHTPAKPAKPSNVTVPPVSGTESDSDSLITPDVHSAWHNTGGAAHAGSSSLPPLSSIAERRSGSGEDSDDEEDEEGGWKVEDEEGKMKRSAEESVIKAGYLWKKGERRKTWKKRWFVLRPAHLAYYKNSAEYQLLRLLDLADIHSCTKVALKRHENTFGLVSPLRTFYLQAKSPHEVQEWVGAIDEARQTLMATSTQNSVTNPIDIPQTKSVSSTHQPSITPSPPTHIFRAQNVTSSDSEDGSPGVQRTYSTASQNIPAAPPSPTRVQFAPSKDYSTTKPIVSGYLMKCGSKRHNWRKRWFILTSDKLVYCRSHMNTKPHRHFAFSEILDALEYDLPPNRQNPSIISSPVSSPPAMTSPTAEDGEKPERAHTFKIVTTQRTLLVCAPSEEEEIKWLGAICALIARRSEAGVVPGQPKASTGSPEITSGSSKARTRGLSISGSAGMTGDIIPDTVALQRRHG